MKREMEMEMEMGMEMGMETKDSNSLDHASNPLVEVLLVLALLDGISLGRTLDLRALLLGLLEQGPQALSLELDLVVNLARLLVLVLILARQLDLDRSAEELGQAIEGLDLLLVLVLLAVHVERLGTDDRAQKGEQPLSVDWVLGVGFALLESDLNLAKQEAVRVCTNAVQIVDSHLVSLPLVLLTRESDVALLTNRRRPEGRVLQISLTQLGQNDEQVDQALW